MVLVFLKIIKSLGMIIQEIRMRYIMMKGSIFLFKIRGVK